MDVKRPAGDWRTPASTPPRRECDRFAVAMEGLRQEVREQGDALRLEMTARSEALRSEMDGLRGEMNGLGESLRSEVRTIKWLLGFLFASLLPFYALLLRIAFPGA